MFFLFKTNPKIPIKKSIKDKFIVILYCLYMCACIFLFLCNKRRKPTYVNNTFNRLNNKVYYKAIKSLMYIIYKSIKLNSKYNIRLLPPIIQKLMLKTDKKKK